MPYNLTDEQQSIIKAVQDNRVVTVEAVAGSSKSFTGKKVSEKIGGEQLYIVFSKALQLEASKDLTSNVEVRTIHSLAYREVIGKNKKLPKYKHIDRYKVTNSNYKINELKKYMLSKCNYVVLIKSLEKWFASDLSIEDSVLLVEDTFYELNNTLTDIPNKENEHTKQSLLKVIEAILSAELDMTHSAYLKYYHLLIMAKCATKLRYRLVILDEAQDVSKVTIAIVKSIVADRYLILGDSAQAIFGSFMFTVNAFKYFEKYATKRRLSKSFRVDKDIAIHVEKFCKKYIDKDMIFKGMDYTDEEKLTINSEMYITRTNKDLILKMMECSTRNIKYNLTRNPATIFSVVNTLIFIKENKKIDKPEFQYLERDRLNYLDTLRANQIIPSGDTDTVFTVSGFMGYIMKIHKDDINLVSSAKLVIHIIKNRLTKQFLQIQKESKEYFESKTKYKLTLSTAHASKGLTVDLVVISEDLNEAILKAIEKVNKNKETLSTREEFLLYYVACTRCRFRLINSIITENL